MTSKDFTLKAGYRRGRDGADQPQETTLKAAKALGRPLTGYAVAVCSQCGTSHPKPARPGTQIDGFQCRACGFQHTNANYTYPSPN